jgi:uncharacterized protein (TIGR02996 family)
MEHPDWDAFLAAIVSDPDDDTARLVAADFLEENGHADRASFIRIQIELARLEAAGEGKSLEADELRKRERVHLGPLAVYSKLWAAEACPELVSVNARGGIDVQITGADRLTWRRGFVEGVTCRADDWLHHGRTVRSRNPIRTVVLTATAGITRDQWYELIPALKSLNELWVEETGPIALEWLRGWLPGVEVYRLAN